MSKPWAMYADPNRDDRLRQNASEPPEAESPGRSSVTDNTLPTAEPQDEHHCAACGRFFKNFGNAVSMRDGNMHQRCADAYNKGIMSRVKWWEALHATYYAVFQKQAPESMKACDVSHNIVDEARWHLELYTALSQLLSACESVDTNRNGTDAIGCGFGSVMQEMEHASNTLGRYRGRFNP